MIVTTQMLIERYKNYSDPKGKIFRDIHKGKLFPINKGIYETERNTSGEKLAQVIYGPSYLSFDYALAEYGLIPERVYWFTSATYNKRKRKYYTNEFGNYSYRDVPKDVYYLDILIKQEGDYVYQIATKEKALCDKLYTISPVSNIKELKALLFEDLRIDEDEFENLNKVKLMDLAKLYHTKNHDLLIKMLKEEK